MKSFAYPRLTSIVAVFFCFCALTFFKVVRHIEANSTSSLPTRDTTAIDSIRNLPSHETDSTSTDRHAARLNNESIKMGVGMLSSSQPGAANFDVLAGTINVNTTADENGTGAGCSLREAIISANTTVSPGLQDTF